MLAACQRHRLMNNRLFGLQQSAFVGLIHQSVHRRTPCRSTETSRAWVPPFRQIFRRWFHSQGAGSSGLDMSMAKVLDTLQVDYPTLFSPGAELDFDIYDDNITFELGKPLDRTKMGYVQLQGKAKYKHALHFVKNLVIAFTAEGEVQITHITTGKDGPGGFRIRWRCQGRGRFIQYPLHVDGVSVYKLGPSSAGRTDPSMPVSHPVVHHTLEFMSFEPPFLLDLIRPVWWDPAARYRPPVTCICRNPVQKPDAACSHAMSDTRAVRHGMCDLPCTCSVVGSL